MKALAIIYLSLASLAVATKATTGFYTILAPNAIRPYSDYKVVCNWDMPVANTLSVKVLGKDGSGQTKYSDTKDVSLEPHSTENVHFYFHNVEKLTYNLVVTGQGINETRALTFNPKSYSALVQTDKFLYKPKDKVQFRVFLVNSDTNCIKSRKRLAVRIKDPNNNLLELWSNASTPQGVFSDFFRVSSNPAFGTYKIEVEFAGETNVKTFQVVEYVLPKFAVTASGQYSANKVIVNVGAKYTFGQAVQGTATVTARLNGFGQPVQKSVPIFGTAVVEFTASELGISANNRYRVALNVEVLDSTSGTVQKTTTNVQIYSSAYNLEFLEIPEWKKGLPYVAKVQVTSNDGSSKPLDSQKLKISADFGLGQKVAPTVQALKKPGPVIIIIIIIIVPAEAKSLSFEATYEDVSANRRNIVQARSDSNSFITASLVNVDPKLGDDITIKVESTEKVEKFYYIGLGRGEILLTGLVRGANTFVFCTNFKMVPEVTLVVYYVRTDGEVVSEFLVISLKPDLKNDISLGLSQDNVEPGANVTLDIATKQGSYVALTGVDLSVKLLGDKNYITKDQVFLELSQYGLLATFNNNLRFPPRIRRRLDDFAKSGLLVITNTKQKTSDPSPIPMFFRTAMTSARPEVAFNDAVTTEKAPESEVDVRKDFPETWLWEDFRNVNCGNFSRTFKVPETITSYHISAITNHCKCGFGLTTSPAVLTIFKQFFIAVNLPYSVVNGERTCVTVGVYNYGPVAVAATVVFYGTDGFEFVEAGSGPNRQKKVLVQPNSSTPVLFCIKLTKPGSLPIKVTATTSNAGDGVQLYLNCISEGVVKFENDAKLIDLRNTKQSSTEFKCNLPKGFIPGSQQAEISCIGDLLGPVLSNLEQLVRVPCGCGEQNLIYLLPNVFVYEYLTAINKLTAALKSRILSNMQTGYQNQLRYQRSDGSFSAFGNQDAKGSTWLTAATLQAFERVRRAGVTVDTTVTDRAYAYLTSVQKPDGSFPENGNVIHKEMQGASGNGAALVAYVTLVFQKYGSSAYAVNVNKALAYLKATVNAGSSVYELAITAYCLALANDVSKVTYLNWLKAKAITVGGQTYWENQAPAAPLAVEITSYALLVYVANNEPEGSLHPIAKYLVSKRNSLGGCESTQDTIMSLDALTTYSRLFLSSSLSLDLKITTPYDPVINWRIDSSNALVLQKQDLDSRTNSATALATGSGLALCQLSCRYNVPATPTPESFDVSVRVEQSKNPNKLLLKICVRYKAGKVSNMAVVEVFFPSGYVFNTDSKPEAKGLKKFETEDGGTKLVVYLDNLTPEELCFTVSADKVFSVQDLKPTPVKVYDYYDRTKSGQSSYTVESVSPNPTVRVTTKVVKPVTRKPSPNVFMD